MVGVLSDLVAVIVAGILGAAAALKLLDSKTALARWPRLYERLSKRSSFRLAVFLEGGVAIAIVMVPYRDVAMALGACFLAGLGMSASKLKRSGGSCPCFGRIGGRVTGRHLFGLYGAAIVCVCLALAVGLGTPPQSRRVLNAELGQWALCVVATLTLAASGMGRLATRRAARRLETAIGRASRMTVVVSNSCPECLALAVEARAWSGFDSAAVKVCDVGSALEEWKRMEGFGLPAGILENDRNEALAVVAGAAPVRRAWETLEDQILRGQGVRWVDDHAIGELPVSRPN